MKKDDLLILLRSNFQANDRFLVACDRLSVDQFSRQVTPDTGQGSLRGILVHILDAEYGWRAALQSPETDSIRRSTTFRRANSKGLILNRSDPKTEGVYNSGVTPLPPLA